MHQLFCVTWEYSPLFAHHLDDPLSLNWRLLDCVASLEIACHVRVADREFATRCLISVHVTTFDFLFNDYSRLIVVASVATNEASLTHWLALFNFCHSLVEVRVNLLLPGRPLYLLSLG